MFLAISFLRFGINPTIVKRVSGILIGLMGRNKSLIAKIFVIHPIKAPTTVNKRTVKNDS